MATPTLTDQTAGPGYVRVQWTDATKPADFFSWRVYHKESADSVWTKIYETFVDSAAYDINSYGWANVVAQDYVVAGVSQDTTTGVLTEQALTGAATITPAGSGNDYWLVHPDTPALTTKLRMVTAAPHASDIDHQAIRLIGRGNKVNTGDDSKERSGSLSFQLFDEAAGRTAREQRQDVETLFYEGVRVYLRTPFGDLWSVFVSQVSFDPISVAGTMEAASGSLSYLEVA